MRLSAEIRYEAGPKRVFGMIVDPAFQAAKCAATGSLEHEVDVTEHADGGATVFTRRTLPTDQVPDAVRVLVGRTVHLAETQCWEPERADGSRSGTIRVEIEGTPLRFTASTALVPVGEGTRQPIDGELRANVPLIGGRIEKAAEPAVRGAIRVEERTGTSWLAER
ncbi:MAG TPA: DUF2505 domain-containing protein [Kineosporiaceae bacterium]